MDGLRDEGRFVRLVLSDPSGTEGGAWLKVVVQPVLLGSGRALQAVFRGERKEKHLTMKGGDVAARLAELLGMGFRRVHLQCIDEDVHVRITKKGKALVKVGKPSVTTLQAPSAHDRRKNYPLPAGRADGFLEAAGIMRHGRVRASMQDKFRQINCFLDVLRQARLLSDERPARVRIVDCGCGRALLSFAACHYLRDVAGIAVGLVGVDEDSEVVASAEALRERLGEEDVELVQARILEYEPREGADIVLSLHACDTATDEALAQGVKWGARLILAAPCCQHELHHRIERSEFGAVLRHGILRERMADILTDSLRAAALRVMGYKADVIEFISPGHTAKNLMIRAEKVRGIHRRAMADEYVRLRDFWGVAPAIEALLGEAFGEALRRG